MAVADHGSGALTVTDTLGRSMLSTSGFGASGDTVAISGLTGSYTMTWGTANSNYAIGQQLLLPPNPSCTSLPNDVQSLSVITKITLPNGAFYAFFYDSTYGLISKVTYPNGGYVSYSYGLSVLSEFATFEGVEGLSTCYYEYDTAVVKHRYVSFDGVHIALQQDFDYSTNWGTLLGYWATKTTTVTTTDNVSGQSYTTKYTYSPVTLDWQPNDQTQFPGQAPLEQTIEYKDATGAKLRTVTKSWFDMYELKNQQTTLENNLTSQTAYTYGPGAQVTEQLDYDYGGCAAGPLLRQIKTTYQSFPNTPIFPSKASIFDRPSQVIVYDRAANRLSESDFAYDEVAVSQVSLALPAGTHDGTNYSSTGTATRGNATTKTFKCFVGSTGCTDSIMKYTYDETGQLLTVKDACGNGVCSDMTGTNHTTVYSYTDSYPPGNTNAYLTQKTDALGHSASFAHGYNDGQVTSATDLNGRTTRYIYNTPPTGCSFADALNRLSEIK